MLITNKSKNYISILFAIVLIGGICNDTFAGIYESVEAKELSLLDSESEVEKDFEDLYQHNPALTSQLVQKETCSSSLNSRNLAVKEPADLIILFHRLKIDC